MRVAYFSSSADRKNGWGTQAVETIAAWKRQHGPAMVVDLYLPTEELDKTYTKDLGFVDGLHFTLPSFAYSLRNPRRMLQFIKTKTLARTPDIIHALDFPYAISAMYESKRCGAPYIITLCGTFYKPRYALPDQFFFSKAYANAAQVNAVSDYTLDAATNLFSLDRQKTNVIHAGVNFERFSKPFDTTELCQTFGPNKKIILGVGALKARKGFDVVIRAMAEVRRTHPDAVYVIVGDGSDRGALEALVQSLGLDTHVSFAGFVSDEELPAYFHAADVYCHTPRNIDGAFEGFGIVYLQAGAAKKPVIGSRSGGVSSAVVHNKTGLLVRQDDVHETAQAIVRLLENRTVAEKLGVAGHAYAKEHDWSRIAEQQYRVYQSILQ